MRPDKKRTLAASPMARRNTILAGTAISKTSHQERCQCHTVEPYLRRRHHGHHASGKERRRQPAGATLERDSDVAPTIGSWGGPFCAGRPDRHVRRVTVRMAPYGMKGFSAMLTRPAVIEVVVVGCVKRTPRGRTICVQQWYPTGASGEYA